MNTQGSSLFSSLSRKDLQGLYDHLGTMPFAPGSWSNNWRSALSEVLHLGAPASVVPPVTDGPAGPCWNERHELLSDVVAAAWGYRVAYEGYWGAGIPDSELPVETKQRLLAALVGWQEELDRALARLDDDPGDFASAKAAHRQTIEGLIAE